MRRSGGMVDAAVSKTVGGQPPCRFESDLRHHGLNLTGLQQKSMGFVNVNAGLCNGGTGDSTYANKSELLNQPIRCITARGEMGKREENKLALILQGELYGSE